MSWYSTGTVDVTNGDADIVGTGTSWLDVVQPGWAFFGPDGRPYQVQDVVDNTHITLAKVYAGSTLTTQAYDMFPTQGMVRTLSNRVTTLLNDYAAVLTGAGAGKFSAGTVGAPGVTNAADLDTGLFWPSANVAALGAGGVGGIFVDASGNVGAGFIGSVASVRMDIRGNAPSARVYDTTGGNSLASMTADSTGAVFEAGFASTPTAMIFKTASAVRMTLTAAGDLILRPQSSAPTLATNGELVINAISNTQLRFSYRGSDGTTRTNTLTLA